MTLVLPEFALIALGALLRRSAFRSPDFWSQLERLVYLVLFPALLLRATLGAQLGVGAALPLVAAGLAGTLAGVGLGELARPLLRPDRESHASGVQTAYRFNSYIALAAVEDFGPSATAALGLLLGVNVPLVNVLAVTALARGTTVAGRRGVAPELVRNPLVLATVAGLGGQLAGLRLPALVDSGLSRLAAAAIPLGLLSVGAGLRRGGLPGRRRVLAAYFALVKLVAVPTVALLAARALDLGAQTAAVVAFAAAPPATASYILAVRMGGDGPFVAASVTLATTGALLTLPLWLAVAGG